MRLIALPWQGGSLPEVIAVTAEFGGVHIGASRCESLLPGAYLSCTAVICPRNKPRFLLASENMKNLDNSWNAQDLKTFRRYHAKDCIVRWPNQPPTHGIDAHEQEAISFFKTFPDQHLVNNPYKIMLAQGEWTCTVADYTGTMKGSMTMPDGSVIQPTNKSFHIDFCTVARWHKDGQIVEENLFYDLMGMLKQIGIIPGEQQKAA